MTTSFSADTVAEPPQRVGDAGEAVADDGRRRGGPVGAGGERGGQEVGPWPIAPSTMEISVPCCSTGPRRRCANAASTPCPCGSSPGRPASATAPRSHFVDRKALLDALAERGFTRLTDEIREADARAPGDFPRTLRAACAAYVTFAAREPALLDLMFAAKVDDPSEPVRRAAERLFATMTDIMRTGVDAGAYPAADTARLTLLLSATVQGISALVTSRRITTPQSEALIDDAISLFLAKAPGSRLPGSR